MYPTETQAIEYVREEKQKSAAEDAISDSYARRLGLPPEDVSLSFAFWEEPPTQEVQGEETILFRVGKYVGDYTVEVHHPPKIADGFFIPLELHELLVTYLMETDIAKLRAQLPMTSTLPQSDGQHQLVAV